MTGQAQRRCAVRHRLITQDDLIGVRQGNNDGNIHVAGVTFLTLGTMVTELDRGIIVLVYPGLRVPDALVEADNPAM